MRSALSAKRGFNGQQDDRVDAQLPVQSMRFMGIEKLGTVHVLGKDEHEELQIVAFCYDCARVMMERRRRPRVRIRNAGNSPIPSTANKRVVSLNLPKRTSESGWEACLGTINKLSRVIGDFRGEVESTRVTVSASKEARRARLLQRENARGSNTPRCRAQSKGSVNQETELL